ncbi:hypothetical protein F2Q69_00013843 [Brassica cretica]|uniref:Uncharacterized protein n=1 Tax=Brassica cretica TaxID=69181 RepID=A0A8S9QQ27_BRACR|nr:hypothetical protein F2Q69_00013843 [Brassica cretica]
MYSLIRHGRKTLEFQKWLHLRFAANILLNEPVCGEEDELAAGGSGFVSSGAWIKLGEEDCPKVGRGWMIDDEDGLLLQAVDGYKDVLLLLRHRITLLGV